MFRFLTTCEKRPFAGCLLLRPARPIKQGASFPQPNPQARSSIAMFKSTAHSQLVLATLGDLPLLQIFRVNIQTALEDYLQPHLQVTHQSFPRSPCNKTFEASLTARWTQSHLQQSQSSANVTELFRGMWADIGGIRSESLLTFELIVGQIEYSEIC